MILLDKEDIFRKERKYEEDSSESNYNWLFCLREVGFFEFFFFLKMLFCSFWIGWCLFLVIIIYYEYIFDSIL